MGSVRRDSSRCGDHYSLMLSALCYTATPRKFSTFFRFENVVKGDRRTILMQPSHELEQKVSFPTRFHDTANTSRLCSCHDCTGKLSSPMSNSFIEPSPAATTTWFSCASDQETSKRASCVSNLEYKFSLV